jgi:hypothetical protein
MSPLSPMSDKQRTALVVRVVKFGVHAPSRRKQAMLDDALRRQTIAYGRALEAAKPFAVAQLIIQARMELHHNREKTLRDDLRLREREATTRIAGAAYRAARGAHCSSTMADGLVEAVKATLQSWIGWRLRFRKERAGRIKRAEERLAGVLADPDEALKSLQARRRNPALTIEHVLTGVRSNVKRHRERRPPSYPLGPRLVAPDGGAVEHLTALATSTTKIQEDAARDALANDPKIGRAPLSWSRASGDLARGVSLVRGSNGSIHAFLPGILPKEARRLSRPQWNGPKLIHGVDEAVRMPRTGGVRVPLSFPKSAWQYMDGWKPRTAKLVWRGAGRYELHIAFAREIEAAIPNDAVWIGLDRGVQHIAVATDEAGNSPFISGNRLAPVEKRVRRAREAAQKRGRAVRAAKRSYRETARNEVNRIAKHVAKLVVNRRAMLAVEDLQAFARGDSRVLARAQYAALLTAVDKRLELAGRLPMRRGGARYWEVHAAHTSTTCPFCGRIDAASRPERDLFKCVACGHEDHADVNAARNIARRGRENRGKYEITRSRKAQRDGGGGPASDQGAGVVSAPVSAAAASRGDGGANSPMDGNNVGGTSIPQRARSALLSEIATAKRRIGPQGQRLSLGQVAAGGALRAHRNSPPKEPPHD